jgi:hypothetical protein
MPLLGQGLWLSPWPAMGRPWAYPPPSVSTGTSRPPSANPDITADVIGMPADWRPLLCPHNMPTTSPWRNRHAGTMWSGRRAPRIPAGARPMVRRRSLYPATFVTARLTANARAVRGADVARGVLLRLAQNGGGCRSDAMVTSLGCGVGFRQINDSRPSLGARAPAPAGFRRLEPGVIRPRVHRQCRHCLTQSPGRLPATRFAAPDPRRSKK